VIRVNTSGGGASRFLSSVGTYATPKTLMTMVWLLTAYVAVALLSYRAMRRPLARLTPRQGWLLAGGAVLLVVLGCNKVERVYGRSGRWDKAVRSVHASPHWAMIRSFWSAFSGGRASDLEAAVAALDERPDAAAIAAWPAGPQPVAVEPGRRPRNVIFVILESTSVQYLKLYGGSLEMPALEAEAAHALVFDDFYAHDTSTAFTVYSLLTSNYSRLDWRWSTGGTSPLSPSLPHLLAPLGYRSAFITSAGLDWANEREFVARGGFDVVQDWQDLGAPQLNSWGAADAVMTDGVVRFIDADRSRPFVVMAWTNQSHHPYSLAPGQPLLPLAAGEALDSPLNHYLNCLREADRQLGRLFAALRERGLSDDTLVVITGDHGEAFGSPHPTVGHAKDLFEECVHVPCILWNPRLFRGGHSRTIGGHIDLNPTVLDLLGLPAVAEMQGRSLFDPTRLPRAFFFCADADFVVGVREGRWKMLFYEGEDRTELFDLRTDPKEQRDLSPQLPQQRDELMRHLARWVSSEERRWQNRPDASQSGAAPPRPH
jgi:arylsulfatase A-like enzyme